MRASFDHSETLIFQLFARLAPRPFFNARMALSSLYLVRTSIYTSSRLSSGWLKIGGPWSSFSRTRRTAEEIRILAIMPDEVLNVDRLYDGDVTFSLPLGSSFPLVIQLFAGGKTLHC